MPELSYEDVSDVDLLKAWRMADRDVALGGQSVAIRGRVLTRADAAEITRKIAYYQRLVSAAAGGSREVHAVHGRRDGSSL
jgi:hypothetical protein